MKVTKTISNSIAAIGADSTSLRVYFKDKSGEVGNVWEYASDHALSIEHDILTSESIGKAWGGYRAALTPLGRKLEGAERAAAMIEYAEAT